MRKSGYPIFADWKKTLEHWAAALRGEFDKDKPIVDYRDDAIPDSPSGVWDASVDRYEYQESRDGKSITLWVRMFATPAAASTCLRFKLPKLSDTGPNQLFPIFTKNNGSDEGGGYVVIETETQLACVYRQNGSSFANTGEAGFGGTITYRV